MTGPRLIGIVPLTIAKTKKVDDKVTDRIKYVAFDTDGQAWGLVERFTSLADASFPSAAYGCVDNHRWVKFDALPFAEAEVVTDEWKPVK